MYRLCGNIWGGSHGFARFALRGGIYGGVSNGAVDSDRRTRIRRKPVSGILRDMAQAGRDR